MQKSSMFIYKITNLINKKIYVGQTIKKLKERWIQHRYLMKKNIYLELYNEMNYYGIENFKIEKIQTCNSIKQLNTREKFWIKKLKSQNIDIGYNILDGGRPSIMEKRDKLNKKRLKKTITNLKKEELFQRMI